MQGGDCASYSGCHAEASDEDKIPNLRQRIRTLAYRLASQAARIMPHTSNSFISEEQQAELLAEMLGLESVEGLGLESATGREAVTTRDAVAMVRNTEVKRCFNQEVLKRVKNR